MAAGGAWRCKTPQAKARPGPKSRQLLLTVINYVKIRFKCFRLRKHLRRSVRAGRRVVGKPRLKSFWPD